MRCSNLLRSFFVADSVLENKNEHNQPHDQI